MATVTSLTLGRQPRRPMTKVEHRVGDCHGHGSVEVRLDGGDVLVTYARRCRTVYSVPS